MHEQEHTYNNLDHIKPPRYLAPLLVASTALGMLIGNAVQLDDGQPTDYAAEQADGPDVCPEVEQKYIDEVEDLLSEGTEQAATRRLRATTSHLEAKHHVTIPHAEIDSFELSLSEDRAEVFTESATGETNVYYSQPYSYYQEKVTPVLATYGIELVVLDEGQTMDEDGMAGYSSTEMNSQKAKANLIRMVRHLYPTPVELISYLGVTQVVVGNILKPDTSGYANTTPFPETVFIDALAMNERTLLHEAGHVWDGANCGNEGMYEDPQFAALMPQTVKSSDRSLQSKLLGGPGAYESMGRIVATSNYALEETREGGIVENKAEIIARIGDIESYDTLSDAGPFVSSQHRLLMARLYRDAPNAVAYMIEL
ncbi:hypothetical protein KA047_00285 [Candidatus Saccharibacteria bacterium]|nr:hypothetical protein [Candidatus Saccharibacteria bacterium]